MPKREYVEILKQTTTFVKFELFQNQRFQNHSAKNLESARVDFTPAC